MRRECGKVSDKAETIVRFLQCTKTVAFGPVRHSILIDVVTMRAKGKGDKEGTKADHGEHRQKGMSQTRLKLLLGSCSAPKRLPLDLCVIVSSLTSQMAANVKASKRRRRRGERESEKKRPPGAQEALGWGSVVAKRSVSGKKVPRPCAIDKRPAAKSSSALSPGGERIEQKSNARSKSGHMDMSQTRLKLLLGSCSAPKRLPLDLCVIVSSLTFHSKVE